MESDPSSTVEPGCLLANYSGKTSKASDKAKRFQAAKLSAMKPGKVYIKRVSRKRFLQLAWLDPNTGKERRRSAKTGRRREAEALAAQIERTIYRGVPVDSVSWDAFCLRYRAEHVANLKDSSQSDWLTVQRSVEASIEPATLRCLTPSAISEYTAELMADERKGPDTVARYLRTLRAALKWAERLRLIDQAPYISIPRQARRRRQMKGRPITTEEFERMLAAVTAGPDGILEEVSHIQSWKHLLRVLWLSGLRLSEIPLLYWDRPDRYQIVGIDRRRPMLQIHADLEKGNQDRLYPLTPDLVRLLRETPRRDRSGLVCKPLTSKGITTSVTTICRVISAIGERANVVVNPISGKFASAHDLRRSFGTRWAPLVQPPVLQQLMRHKSLQTTMSYYVELRAVDTADALWAAMGADDGRDSGDLSGDPEPISPGRSCRRAAVS